MFASVTPRVSTPSLSVALGSADLVIWVLKLLIDLLFKGQNQMVIMFSGFITAHLDRFKTENQMVHDLPSLVEKSGIMGISLNMHLLW